MAMRKSKGRQKVEIAKMQNDSNLQVTFSKRRTGLFKKASELCTLCGAEIAIIVFSPGKKVFSFGHPSVEMVMDRLFTQNIPQASPTTKFVEAHRNANVRELNVQLTQVTNQLDMEKKRGEELSKIIKGRQRGCWWEAPIEQLSLPQLEQLKASMEDLRKNVARQADNLLIQNTNHSQYFPSTSNGKVVPFDMRSAGVNRNMVPQYGYNIRYGQGFY